MTIEINLQKESLKCFQKRDNKEAFRKLEIQEAKGLDRVLQIESNVARSEAELYISGFHTAAIIALEGMRNSKDEIVGYTSKSSTSKSQFDYYMARPVIDFVFLDSTYQTNSMRT